MTTDKKLIGICLTKIHNRTRADYVNRLHAIASKQGYKLIIFNSLVDFYNIHSYDDGARAIFDAINYDKLSALVIISENFYNPDIYNRIIDRAKEKSLPVIVLYKEISGCYCIMKNYDEAYKSVIRHVVEDHGVTDTFYVAGKATDDENSERRIRCYKEVLEENGLTFSYDNVGYGEYWNLPAIAVLDEQIKKRGKPPKAVFCANDYMAIAICERLQHLGYRIPEDIIVTGFDGVPDAEYFNPKLTTCREDVDGLARTTVRLVDGAKKGGLECGIYYQEYEPHIAKSCGCSSTETINADTTYLFHLMQEMESHEAYIHSWTDKMIACSDMTELCRMLSSAILPGTFMCLKKSFLESFADYELKYKLSDHENELVLLSTENKVFQSLNELPVMNMNQMVPNYENWVYNDSSYILSAIYVDNQTCGYYAVKTIDVFGCAHQLNRISKSTNIVLGAALNRFKEKMMRASMERAALRNSLTKLLNLKGATRWFDDFAADDENHAKILSISVYGLPKYKYIYENFGMENIEEAICMTADALRKANPENCMIAQISEDEFIVFNYFDSWEAIGDTINNATTVFFKEVEIYNSKEKPYFVEVNCGCTVVDPGWDEKLETFIKLASNEMYLNRLKMGGQGDAIKEENSSKDLYNIFKILLEKNLFTYHFQPIVDVRNAEIYGYEALMRTDSSIGMNPLEVLDTAKAYKRLYDIERATLFNAMGGFVDNYDKFCGKKLFINSIPGYPMKENDSKELTEKFGKYMNNFVFEITELNSISDSELSSMKSLGGAQGTNLIAIDDYGTGHSNIVNLLRYAPHIIKIDRFLINNIQNDINKQMFVKSTIEFAKMNNVKVLAEGVETYDELHAVITFGVDYVQGYYTGRPAPEPVPSINNKIRNEILGMTPLYY